MGRNRFIKSGSKRIDLTDGDWIEIKRDLNSGETKAVEAAGETPPVIVIGPDGKEKVVERVDWTRYEFDRALVYLTRWSFIDGEGEDAQPMEISLDSLRALDPESFSEISAAILTHILETAATKKAQRLARMKQTGESASSKSDDESTPGPISVS